MMERSFWFATLFCRRRRRHCCWWFGPIGLFVVWWFFLVPAPTYATTFAPANPLSSSSRVQHQTSYVLFTVPKPFTRKSTLLHQATAINSWFSVFGDELKRVIFLGNDTNYNVIQSLVNDAYGDTIEIEPRIDTNFLGMPLFNSMIYRVQAEDCDVAIFLNTDIVLTDSVKRSIVKLHARFDRFFAVGARWDINAKLVTPWFVRSRENPRGSLEDVVRQHATLHTYGGVDMFILNRPRAPLLGSHIPPFVMGRGKYDNWIIHEAINHSAREVVDISEGGLSVHLNHHYKHLGKKKATKANMWSSNKRSLWETYVNINLATGTGTYANQDGTVFHAPWKLTSCHDFSDQDTNLCLQRRVRPMTCPCESSNFVLKTQTDPTTNARTGVIRCGSRSTEAHDQFLIQTEVPLIDKKIGMPHTLSELLDALGRPDTVILTAASYDYREMVMSFVCNLRRLGIRSFVISALDEEMYRYLYIRGVPVYLTDALGTSGGGAGGARDDCHYGTPCFKAITKLKSREVLHLLRTQGVNVLWSDADIVWYADPRPILLRTMAAAEERLARHAGESVFLIQSNQPKPEEPINDIRRINSGFYLAMANAPTIDAFDAITRHAMKTTLTEQPSFYDVLCSVDGAFRRGNSRCFQPDLGVHTVYLPLDLFPNGASHDFWDNPPLMDAPRSSSSPYILHNNWLSGTENKIKRQRDHGLYFYNAPLVACQWDWMEEGAFE